MSHRALQAIFITLGWLILGVAIASILIALFNTARADPARFVLVCTDTKVMPTEVSIFRSSFEKE